MSILSNPMLYVIIGSFVFPFALQIIKNNSVFIQSRKWFLYLIVTVIVAVGALLTDYQVDGKVLLDTYITTFAAGLGAAQFSYSWIVSYIIPTKKT